MCIYLFLFLAISMSFAWDPIPMAINQPGSFVHLLSHKSLTPEHSLHLVQVFWPPVAMAKLAHGTYMHIDYI